MSLDFADCDDVYEAGFAQVGECPAHIVGWVVEVRDDLLERERPVLSEQDEDRQLHIARRTSVAAWR